jgi:hypothetical protein
MNLLAFANVPADLEIRKRPFFWLEDFGLTQVSLRKVVNDTATVALLVLILNGSQVL